MKNTSGLIPYKKGDKAVSTEIQKARGSKGGKKSGEVRRNKRALREAMKTILEMPTAGKTKELLISLGYNPDDQSNADAIAATLFSDAMLGDKKSMEMLLQFFFQANDDERKTAESNARVQAMAKNGVDVSVQSGDDDGGVVIYLPKIEEEGDGQS